MQFLAVLENSVTVATKIPSEEIGIDGGVGPYNRRPISRYHGSRKEVIYRLDTVLEVSM